ncbi:hypothetical protein [Streptomyces sp. NPDC051001]|uniref:hypothetical protein n=1 Tax=Streptomyces sp. NPDC051001 TaxID=3155795 RepID=UPI00343A7323
MSQSGAHDWWSIREWAGSQHRAFEELCFQLRSPAPPGWETIKTAAPDGGVEWYDQAADGSAAHGYQVKFVRGIDELLPLARESAKTVGSNIEHRKIVRLEFLAPFDLSDPTPFTPAGRRRRGARERWNDNVAAWKAELEGLAAVDIRFVGGGELLERLTSPGNEGRQWFFFEKRALGRGWYDEQVRMTERLASSRYTPAHHVALPLGRVADACALQQEFLRDMVQRARDVRSAVRSFTAEVRWWRGRHPVPHDCSEYEALAQWVHEWAAPLEEGADRLVTDLSTVTAMTGFPGRQSAAVLKDILEGFSLFHHLAHRYTAAGPEIVVGSSDESVPPASGAPEPGESLSSVREGTLARAERVCSQLLASLTADAARAAQAGTWLLLGEAGQGKTHLLIDAVQRAVAEGRPALIVLGQELSGHHTLEEIARRAGLGQLPARDFLQAMNAAGAAANCRFLLVIDAVNDSDDAAYWKSELRALQSAVAAYPHVALVISCRSTLKRLVVSDAFEGPQTVHHGFAGREMEGLEAYLRAIPDALPRTPLLTSVFTNPLFVKLYADSLGRSREKARPGGTAHPRDRSAVFDSFVDHRAETICERLGLDDLDRPVHRAVNALAAQMANDGIAVLPREQARGIADAYTPTATSWPDTMLGQLITEGIVSNERIYGSADLGIAFPYQAFSDDRIVRSVFTTHADEIAQLRAGSELPADSPLRTWLSEASPNLQEAASILLPEQAGTELIDLLNTTPASSRQGPDPTDNQEEARRFLLARSFLETLALRSTDSVTERTVALLNETTAVYGRGSDHLETLVAVTAEPGHLLNADRLHRMLARMVRPERDAAWGIDTYDMLWDATALHRLLRWAEQYPTPRELHPAFRLPPRRLGAHRSPDPQSSRPADAEVVRLVATTLVWTLTSSNRFLRDRATKALVQLLLGYPDIVLSLLDRFLHQDANKVDDPYLFERLVWVAYGVLARRGWESAKFLSQVTHLLLDHVYGDVRSPAHASRNALLCDAATRIVARALEAGVITAAQASVTRHPHACAEMGPAPEEDELDSRFPVRDEAGNPLWATIHSSLSGLGDFATYEVRPATDHFSMLPLTSSYPQRPRWVRRGDPVEVDPGHIPAFAASLPEPLRPVLTTIAAVTRLLNNGKGRQVLDEEQYALLRACAVVPHEDERRADAQVDHAWAARWVFARVAELGWSPELFAEFDSSRRRLASSHNAHKPERVGKKYQWMALHELVERLANHHHPHRTSEDDPAVYPGAARLLLLDIDPTLPPARHPFTEDDEETTVSDIEHATFPPVNAAHPLAPQAPVLPADDGVNAWIRDPGDLPDLQTLGTRTDDQGREWIVLYEQAADDHDGRGWSRTYGQAELWHRIQSWTVPAAQSSHLFAWLEGRSLIGRWMPEGPQRHSLQLADFPTAPGPWTDSDPDTWHVSTWRSQAQSSSNDAEPEEDDEHAEDGDHEEIDPIQSAAALGLQLIDYTAVTGWRKKQREDKADALTLLAQQWANGPVDDTDDGLDNPFVLRRQTDIDRATGPDGEDVTAVPTTQDYIWESSGADCSLDAAVSVCLPGDLLLRDSGLRRDPDTPCWYDAAGQLQVQYLSFTRPTGTANTLLASREWIEQRLRDLQHHLLQGSLGERQTVRSEHPHTWREFSQTATLSPGGPWTTGKTITTIRRSLR